MKGAGLALALGLLACSGEPARQPDQGAEPARAPLEGRWELTAIGEQAVRRAYPLTLEIGSKRMKADSDCVRMAWRHMHRGPDFVVQRDPVESCARGLDAVEEEFRIRLDNARSFRVRPDGVLLVDTALGGLTFRRSPAVDPDPPAPNALRMSHLGGFRGEWQVAEITGTSSAPPGPIIVSVLPRELHAVSGCLRWNWRLEPDRHDQVTLWQSPSAAPPCARPLHPHESELERIAHGGHLWAAGGALVLWSNNGAVTLRRRA